MAKIVWNKRADMQLVSIQNYLTAEFGEKVAEEFTSRVFTFLNLLAKFPEMGTVENKEKNIRGFLLHRHTTLFYKPEGDKIYLLSLFDNRKDPGKKK